MTTLGVAVALLLGIDPPRDVEGGQGTTGKLQGVWVVTSWVEGGKPVAHKGAAGDLNYRWSISFSGDRFGSLPGAGTEAEFEHFRRYDQGFRFRLRSERSPGQIDIRWSDQDEPCLKGIYKLEGDVLTLCLSPKGRPERYESHPGSETILYVCERAKPNRSEASRLAPGVGSCSSPSGLDRQTGPRKLAGSLNPISLRVPRCR